MVLTFLSVALAYLLTCHGLLEKDEKNPNICGLPRQWLESTSVSIKINKKGFHRELATTVELSPDVPNGLKVLLVHTFPRGIYVDPYQLTSVCCHNDLQILLNSDIDLEMPAHKTSGFVAFVFIPVDERNSKSLMATIPIHCRYHEPSYASEKAVLVNIGHPELLLRGDTCSHLTDSDPHTVVKAPCSAANSSQCLWVKIHNQQEEAYISLEVPVGDSSLVKPVCCGTLLVTMICCVALSKSIWKHRISNQPPT